MKWWEIFKEWFLSLGDKYHVNPYIFGGIYVGAIPFFFLCLSWTIRRRKKGKSIVVPALLTGLCFISAYLYLLVAGKNIPVWVFVFISLMVVYSIYATVKKIRDKTKKGE
ncbi:MAG: hypothetical protein ABIX01_15930 [Chitinophagaceae bacterium]